MILHEMQKRGVLEFEKLRSIVLRRIGPDAEISFLPALDLLYLLGRAEYHLQNDTIEYKAD